MANSYHLRKYNEDGTPWKDWEIKLISDGSLIIRYASSDQWQRGRGIRSINVPPAAFAPKTGLEELMTRMNKKKSEGYVEIESTMPPLKPPSLPETEASAQKKKLKITHIDMGGFF